ncbi:MAG: 2-phosphosulfolactate phosphatase [bacterium]|nr:2-phosphosulfolactate phosphatase [bacterium]
MTKRLRVTYRPLPAAEIADVAVIIDVLRATTTALAALEAGALHVEAVDDVEQARARRMRGMVIAGERGGLRIDGFDHGNSPLELAADTVKGRALALCTTNGSRALRLCRAGVVFAGSIRNAAATAAAVAAAAPDGAFVALQGSGQDAEPTEEDAIAAGAILAALDTRDGIAVDADAPAAAVRTAWARAQGDAAAALLATPHGAYLAGLGVAGDVRYAAELDASPHAVRVAAGVLTLERRPARD